MSIENLNLFEAEKRKSDDPTVIVSVKMPKSVRDQFAAICEAKGVTSSLVLRRFMLATIAEKGGKDE